MSIDELRQIQENFVKELEEANSGAQTSFPYILHELASASLVSDNEVFQVLVIGGSVFKKATLRREDNKLVLLDRGEKQQPRFNTKADVLSFIESELDPEVKVIALNFAYPLKPVFEDGRLDGILIKSMKENRFEGLIGEKLGKTIEDYFQEKQGRKLTVSVGNDTICLLLSGLTRFTSHDIAGGIVGTGMNFALFLDKNRVVNLEAANFDKFPQTPEGRKIDEDSATPGNALFEKEISGAYLHQQFNFLIKHQGLTLAPLSSTFELDAMSQSSNIQLAHIARELLDKSAAFVACAIGGITLFKKKDMVFVMEGSLFWNASQYKERIKELLIELVPHYNVTFVKVEDSPIFGGAKLIS